ncbi:SufD family Fe-S cluster assembly protein [Mycolicibacterium palauense]|uniref:SufD family Fe-S cluster assembly protein n=1 Tax=Mycolicibacterium palauense TaxID=2034511 RepID=UPI000BFED2C7|nr:SufD family Fe-S cluster assembly protein [Mycolicibacterium palauense]
MTSIDGTTGSLTENEVRPLREIGYSAEREHSGTCVIVDNELRRISVRDDGVEIWPIAEALRRYPWVQDLMFNLIPPDFDDLVREFAESTQERVGHFIWVHEGVTLGKPLQSFTLLETPQARQFVHNITVVDRNATMTMLSGAAVWGQTHTGHHVSISETYLREGATCSSVSIERWADGMTVDSYARAHLAAGAHSTDTAIALSGLRSHYCNSATVLEADANSNDQLVVYAPGGTTRTIESEIRLTGAGANAESLTRMVTGDGTIVNRSELTGEAPGVHGYLGCDGLKLTDGGELRSSPSLVAKSSDAQLSHEASIGMISADKIAYLMSTGLSEEDARTLIVQGFLDLDAQRIPEVFRREVQDMVAAAKTGFM